MAIIYTAKNRMLSLFPGFLLLSPTRLRHAVQIPFFIEKSLQVTPQFSLITVLLLILRGGFLWVYWGEKGWGRAGIGKEMKVESS